MSTVSLTTFDLNCLYQTYIFGMHISFPLDIFGTVVGESPDCLLLSGTVVGENPDYVCWVLNVLDEQKCCAKNRVHVFSLSRSNQG